MIRHLRSRTIGVLIIEAVVASFLMVFAFAASASLFDASLRWESQSSNIRKATLIAERKMEELRATAALVPPNTTFAQHIDNVLSGAHPPYPDAPGFDFTVITLDNVHDPVASSGLTPTNGVHSPCSVLYTEPDNPAATDRLGPAGTSAYSFDAYAPTIDRPAGDFQKNNTYNTFPYSRPMTNSFRLVKVTVTFGTGGGRTVDLVSLIGDPILPPAKPNTPPFNLNVTVRTIPAGGASLAGAGSFVDYEIQVRTANNSIVEDVSALWSVHPLTPGTVDIYALNASGTRVRVRRNALSRPGSFCTLFPQVRYEGIEARAETGNINL